MGRDRLTEYFDKVTIHDAFPDWRFKP